MVLVEEHLDVPTTTDPTPTLPTHLIPADNAPLPLPPIDDDAPIITAPPTSIDPLPLSTPVITPSVTPLSHTISPPTLPHYIPDDESLGDTVNAATGTPDDFHLISNPFGPSTTITLTTKCSHPTLLLDLHHHSDISRIVLRSYLPSTPAVRIPRWRSTLRDSYIIAVDDIPIDTIVDITKYIAVDRTSSAKIIFTVVP